MNSSGYDAARAVRETDIEIEEKQVEERRTITNNGIGEENGIGAAKEEKGADSSSSSSDGDHHMKKLDSQIVDVKNEKEGDELYAHLPEHEKAIIKKQLDIPPVKVTFFTLFRYATRNDKIIIAISMICAIAGGAVMPLMTVCVH